jgi:hypothetical protein
MSHCKIWDLLLTCSVCRFDNRKTNVTVEEVQEDLAGVPDLPAPQVQGGLGAIAPLNNDPDEV